MNQSVTDKLKALNHPNQLEIDLIRSLILSIDPNIQEIWKWNAPSFTLEGNDICTFRLQPKQQFQLILHKGAKVVKSKAIMPDDYDHILVYLSADRVLIDLKKYTLDEDFRKTLMDIIQKWILV
jgi:hypothetical protein